MQCKKCNCKDVQFIETKPLQMKTMRRLILFVAIWMLVLGYSNNKLIDVGLGIMWVYIAFRIIDSIRCNRKRIKAVCKNCGKSWYIK